MSECIWEEPPDNMKYNTNCYPQAHKLGYYDSIVSRVVAKLQGRNMGNCDVIPIKIRLFSYVARLTVGYGVFGGRGGAVDWI